MEKPRISDLINAHLLTVEQIQKAQTAFSLARCGEPWTYYSLHALANPEIRKLIQEKLLTAAHVRELFDLSVLNALEDPDVRDLIRTNLLTADQLLKIMDHTKLFDRKTFTSSEFRIVREQIESLPYTEDRLRILPIYDIAFMAILNPDVRDLIRKRLLTVDQILQINAHVLNILGGHVTIDSLTQAYFTLPAAYQAIALANPEIRKLIVEEKLTVAQVFQLFDQCSIDVLENSDVRDLIRNSLLTVEQAARIMTENVRYIFLYEPGVSNLIREHLLTAEQVFQVKKEVRAVNFRTGMRICPLSDPNVRDLIRKRLLTVDQILKMDASVFCYFSDCRVHKLIIDDLLITVEQVFQIVVDGVISVLENPGAQKLIQAGRLPVDQLLRIDNSLVVESLKKPGVQALMQAGRLRADQLLNIEDYRTMDVFENPVVRELIQEGRLQADQLLNIDYAARIALEQPGVQALIRELPLIVEQVLQIATFQAVRALGNPEIIALIREGRLQVDQLHAVTDETEEILHHPNTIDRLRNGQTFEAILATHRTTARPSIIINRAQSTHTASVHKTVSESTTRLLNRYKKKIETDGLETIIGRAKTYIYGLPGDIDSITGEHAKNSAAKRAMLRLTALSYAFTDRVSGISTRQLIALCFLAIHDQNCLACSTVDDACVAFVDGLYQIQREYNFSQDGKDLGGQDRSPMCSGGTFNKFIEKLTGIHLDCTVQFITPEVAALKLPIVVREQTMHYLQSKTNPQSCVYFLAFINLIAQLNQHGVTAIWAQIYAAVSDKMIQEYSSLDRQELIDLINAGEYTELLHDFKIYQKPIQHSTGYQRYCSVMLFSPIRFFAHPQLPEDNHQPEPMLRNNEVMRLYGG